MHAVTLAERHVEITQRSLAAYERELGDLTGAS
jgi:hypothetical protein